MPQRRTVGSFAIEGTVILEGVPRAAKQMNRLENNVGRSGKQMDLHTRKSRRGTQAMLEISRAVEDGSAVWGTQGLTGAIRASINNITQFLTVLGPTAGVVGGLTAGVGVLAFNFFNAGEKTKTLTDSLKGLDEALKSIETRSKLRVEIEQFVDLKRKGQQEAITEKELELNIDREKLEQSLEALGKELRARLIKEIEGFFGLEESLQAAESLLRSIPADRLPGVSDLERQAQQRQLTPEERQRLGPIAKFRQRTQFPAKQERKIIRDALGALLTRADTKSLREALDDLGVDLSEDTKEAIKTINDLTESIRASEKVLGRFKDSLKPRRPAEAPIPEANRDFEKTVRKATREAEDFVTPLEKINNRIKVLNEVLERRPDLQREINALLEEEINKRKKLRPKPAEAPDPRKLDPQSGLPLDEVASRLQRALGFINRQLEARKPKLRAPAAVQGSREAFNSIFRAQAGRQQARDPLNRERNMILNRLEGIQERQLDLLRQQLKENNILDF